MQGHLDMDSNEIHNVTHLAPVQLGYDITVDGSFDMKNYSLKNIQSLTSVPGVTP